MTPSPPSTSTRDAPTDSPPPDSPQRWRAPLGTVLAVGLLAAATARWADLNPTVEADFFFSPTDPQLQESLALEARYPGGELVVVRAEGPDVSSPDYVHRVAGLGTTLEDLPGVGGVYSVATENRNSPLWSRVLLPEGGTATNVVVAVDSLTGPALTDRIEDVLAAHEGPDFRLVASGVPVIVELIRRSLRHDLVVFSATALLLFGLVATAIYRDARLVGGTLTACIGACAATLLLIQVLGIRVGLLTANIVTIVFVLTLSHTVFITANWQRARVGGGDAGTAARTAVHRTLPPSLWCMATTALGFASLWLTSAEPLRELGTAGVTGTAMAILFGYAVVPPWLAAARNVRAGRSSTLRMPTPRRSTLVVVGLVVAGLGTGVFRVNTDPSLIGYFDRDSTIRSGLEAIDRSGGSSPLRIAVRDPGGQRLDNAAGYDRMWALQEALEADPEVGVVLSPAPVLAHARQQPLAGFLPIPALVALMERPELGNLIGGYMVPDRTEVLYALRMIESERRTSREDVVARVRDMAEGAGFEVVSVGGLYDLQGRLADLIASSLRIGLGGLLLLFFFIAWIVARHGPTALAMTACLVGIPAVVLGLFGHLGVAVDIITSPAANVALAMGVDSIIHLVNRVRELRPGPAAPGPVWLRARDELAAPILTACGVICLGFGIFALSDFPPTRRFGFAVILGTLSAAAAAALILPAGMGGRAATDPSEVGPSGTPGASRWSKEA